ncbi:MAG: hypothetical protein K0U93_29540, partial [Gammaproteobacteria bacterium]|nr:hypothetical protein [Gammaproteobacteria bacterium]
SGSADGHIVCLDADCRCDENYFRAIEAHFDANPRCSAASIYYEHPIQGNSPPELDAAILHYELFLRYHVYGLRFAGAPSAFQTLGSCMVVRALDYARQGGMNRRQGGRGFLLSTEIHSAWVVLGDPHDARHSEPTGIASGPVWDGQCGSSVGGRSGAFVARLRTRML